MIDQTKLIALIAISAVLVGIGAVGAWTVQGWRLEALQTRFDGFVAKTKAEGEKAAIAALAIQKANEQRKEQADHENAQSHAALRATIKRLRDANPASGIVPAAATGARRPDLSCFDRAEFGGAVGILVEEIQGIVDQGDTATVDLNTAKKWAQDRNLP